VNASTTGHIGSTDDFHFHATWKLSLEHGCGT
jgi:hypothetical protein